MRKDDISNYFDYAAATPLDPKVLAIMEPYLKEQFYNPSAQYLAAKHIAQDIRKARTRIAHWLGARQAEITFTAGGTEANNLAIHGIMRRYPKANIVVSAIEHESVLEPAGTYDCRVVGVHATGLVDMTALNKAITDKTVLVSIMYANNEVGSIQPIREISRILAFVRAGRRKKGNNLPLYLHTDACQAAAYLDLHTNRLGVDLMTLNAGKIYGPKQCGALYIKSGIELEPQIVGGGQEGGLRSGTENVANIMGFAEALDIVQTRRHDETKRLQNLQQLFFSLIDEQIPQARVNGTKKYRLPSNINVLIPGTDNERLVMQLDEQGIVCATGSACSAADQGPSHVLKAIGLNDSEARASLRFSMGRFTTERAVRRVVTVLAKLVPTF